MQLIIDANIIIAMLIKPGKVIDLFFNNRIEIFAPQLLFDELEKNKEYIIEKSKIDKEWFDFFYTIAQKNVRLIPEEEFLNFREKAEKICPDSKDIVYFALALYLQCSIWSNEKRLKKQKNIKVYSSGDLMELFLTQ